MAAIDKARGLANNFMQTMGGDQRSLYLHHIDNLPDNAQHTQGSQPRSGDGWFHFVVDGSTLYVSVNPESGEVLTSLIEE